MLIRHTMGDRYRLVGAPAYTLDELRAVPALASMADAAESGHRDRLRLLELLEIST